MSCEKAKIISRAGEFSARSRLVLLAYTNLINGVVKGSDDDLRESSGVMSPRSVSLLEKEHLEGLLRERISSLWCLKTSRGGRL